MCFLIGISTRMLPSVGISTFSAFSIDNVSRPDSRELFLFHTTRKKIFISNLAHCHFVEFLVGTFGNIHISSITEELFQFFFVDLITLLVDKGCFSSLVTKIQ